MFTKDIHKGYATGHIHAQVGVVSVICCLLYSLQ